LGLGVGWADGPARVKKGTVPPASVDSPGKDHSLERDSPLFQQSARGPVPPAREPIPSNSDGPDNTVDHLLKAAKHLGIAGFVEEETSIRSEPGDRALHKDTLGDKEAEMESFQKEVNRLRPLTRHTPTVLIEIVAVEVARKKLGVRARDFDRLIGTAAAPDGA